MGALFDSKQLFFFPDTAKFIFVGLNMDNK